MAAAFGADVDPKTAGFWADSQVPFGLDANNGTVTEATWREKPSWISRGHGRQDDPAAGATADVDPRELDGRRGPGKSRDLGVSNPRAVAALIEQAAAGN